MTSRTITRVTRANRDQIISDARAGFPDDTAFDLTASGTLIVNGDTPFAGAYRIVKVKSPRWLGDNGYTFERDLNAADTITLNTAYDYEGVKTSTEARERYFARLVDLIVLNQPPIDQPKPTTREELRPMTADEIAANYDSIFAACSTEAELETVAAGIDFAPMSGALVSLINASYENAIARVRRTRRDALIDKARANGHYVYTCQRCGALHYSTVEVDSVYCTCAFRHIEVASVYSPPVEEAAERTPGTIAHAEAIYQAYGFDRAVDYIDNKMTPAAIVALARALQTRIDGAEMVRAIMSLLREIKEGVTGATVFIPSLDQTREVLEYAPKTNIVIVRPGYNGRDDRQGFRLGVGAIMLPPEPTPAVPAEHKDRQRVIDRALEANRKYTDEEVDRYPLLREVAIDFVRTYRGENSFVQDVAVKLVDRGTLSSGQMRGALNIMVAEARIARAEARDLGWSKADAIEFDRRHNDGGSSAVEDFYIDLRGRKERDLDDAGDAQAPAEEASNEVAPAIPNGWYCVIINPATREQRTIRVGDCPDHFTVKPGTQLLSFLNGPDNTSDYTGFAFLSGRKVSIWRKFQTADALRTAADLLVADPMTSAAEYVKRSKRCFVCNRSLTVEKSIDAGIGPICAEKIGAMGFKLLLGTREAAVEENDARDRLAASCQHTNQPIGASHCIDCGSPLAVTGRTARLASPSPAENALRRARARQAARGEITAEQAQAEIDELFD